MDEAAGVNPEALGGAGARPSTGGPGAISGRPARGMSLPASVLEELSRTPALMRDLVGLADCGGRFAGSASEERGTRSRPYRSAIWLSSTTSRVPRLTSPWTSQRMSSGVRERSRPRVDGTMQKVQLRLHPWCIVMPSEMRGVRAASGGSIR